MTATEALLSRGREALDRGDHQAAGPAFEDALAREVSAAAMEGLAESHYLAGRYAEALAVYERAHAAYRADGELLAAARACRAIAWIHQGVMGNWALFSGWSARARTVLEDAGDDVAAQGWTQLLAGHAEPSPQGQELRYRTALDLGRRSGDAALECEARGYLGLAVALAGRVAEGMALLDESLTAVCAGEIRDLAVVDGTFCGLFFACERTHDIGRAEQWIQAAHELGQRRSLIGAGAICRVHYGGLLLSAGRWSEADAELTEAVRLLGRTDAALADGLVRLADLRVRQGRLEEAAQLLAGLEQHPDAARPLAGLHLARGELALARDVIERVIATADPDPATVGPLLALLVDVELADGATDAAEETAARLDAMAGAQAGDYLRAAAALARGKVCLATATGDARSYLHEALTGFARAQMPVEVARTRLVLARATASTRAEVAVAEARAALDTFERLNAPRYADEAAAVLRTLGVAAAPGPKGRGPLTKRETEVLDLLGHGLSNAEIADRLYISAKTVEHHVGRILTKLGLRNRAEAAAHAVRESTTQGRN